VCRREEGVKKSGKGSSCTRSPSTSGSAGEKIERGRDGVWALGGEKGGEKEPTCRGLYPKGKKSDICLGGKVKGKTRGGGGIEVNSGG